MLEQCMTWIKIAIFAIFISAGVIKWIYARLQEQAARKRAEESAARRMAEQLRTGRPSDDERQEVVMAAPQGFGQDPQARLRELARARQEQLRQMRENRVERAAEAVAPSPVQPSPAVGADTARREMDRRRQQQESQRRKAAAAQRQREAADAQTRQNRQRDALAASERPRPSKRGSPAQRPAATEVDAYAIPESGRSSGAQASASGWTTQRVREAWVVTEILGPPLALRPNDQPGPGSTADVLGALLQQQALGR